jgi:ribosomal protein S18 acetylase RimI-like enzyme
VDYNAKIQAYFRAIARLYAEAIAVPPFTLFLHATDQSDMATFAIPNGPVGGDLCASLEQIKSICAARARKVHIRFLKAYAPELASALQSCGYEEAESWPILVCTRESYRPAALVAGLEMVTISRESSLEEVKEGLDANALGYDLKAALATNDQAELFRQSLGDCRAFTARLDGKPVGAGMFNPIKEAITEVVGIATLAPFRRRGIASYVTAFATEVAFTQGAEAVFLIPENEQAYRIYERVGYNFLTSQLIYKAT